MWLLGDFLYECRALSNNGQDEQPSTGLSSFLTLHFELQEVSPNADEWLFIFTAYSGAGMVAEYQSHPPATAEAFTQVWVEYRQWNTQGARAITVRAWERAIDYLNNVLHQ